MQFVATEIDSLYNSFLPLAIKTEDLNWVHLYYPDLHKDIVLNQKSDYRNSLSQSR